MFWGGNFCLKSFILDHETNNYIEKPSRYEAKVNQVSCRIMIRRLFCAVFSNLQENQHPKWDFRTVRVFQCHSSKKRYLFLAF